MTTFSTDELNLITLYDSGSRKGTIYELREMIGYLLPDEKELLALAEGVIGKLEAMSDEDYDEVSSELTPDYSRVFPDEDSAWGAILPVWPDDTDPDDDIV